MAKDLIGGHDASKNDGSPLDLSEGLVGTALRTAGQPIEADWPADWFSTSGDFTIEVWARLPSGPSRVDYVGQGVGGGWNLEGFPGTLEFEVAFGAFNVNTTFLPNPNEWYHLAITRNGNMYTLYINGGMQTTQVHIAESTLFATPLIIGSFSSQLVLDELSIYDRALGSSELNSIVRGGSSGKCRSLLVTSIIPTVGGDTGTTTVVISGLGFSSGTEVRLQRAGFVDILPTQVLRDLLRTVVDFDLRGQALGVWTLVVSDPSQSSANIQKSFVIEPGRAPQPWADIVGTMTTRLGALNRVYVMYGNSGNTNAVNVHLLITAPASVDLAPHFPFFIPPASIGREFTTEDRVSVISAGDRELIPVLIPIVPSAFTGFLVLDVIFGAQGSTLLTVEVGKP